MKIKSALMRWYKSFNANYIQSKTPTWSPWTALGKDGEKFPFIEIPIEDDITTIVGANESGKSHLLFAIMKVLSGTDSEGKSLRFTDCCLYSLDGEIGNWPYVGLRLQGDAEELEQITQLGQFTDDSKIESVSPKEFAIVLEARVGKVLPYLFVGDRQKLLTEDQLGRLRELLPKARFIKSNLSIASEIELAALLRAYRVQPNLKNSSRFRISSAFGAAQVLADLEWQDEKENGARITKAQLDKVKAAKDRIVKDAIEPAEPGGLEVQLFRDILEIDLSEIEALLEHGDLERSYAEAKITDWNRKLEAKLNLAKFWQQDDQFKIRVNLKRGVLFFEILDKTLATYTFSDRSSGLKYFLSYYIQAKALEATGRTAGAMILMDEPDSYLSILAQRNLLEIFESLVSPDSGHGRCQLIYTTHSPFLINRNFPWRIRLVRKGDSEEGTQHIERSTIRRYEPIRSALGIDCAQTLFMGSTNLVLEGATEQLLIAELIRLFARPSNLSKFIDLNSVVLTSSGGAGSVAGLLEASFWGDERRVAVVVLLDSDAAGAAAAKKLTEPSESKAALIHSTFVAQVGDLISEFEENHKIVTIEDLLPRELYLIALKSWLGSEYLTIAHLLEDEEFGINGLAQSSTRAFSSLEKKYKLDKFTLMKEAIELLGCDEGARFREVVEKNFIMLCEELKSRIGEAETAQLRTSGVTGVRRILSDFLKTRPESADISDLRGRVYVRLLAELPALGIDGKYLRQLIELHLTKIDGLKALGRYRIEGTDWSNWRRTLETIRHDPLSPFLDSMLVDPMTLPSQDDGHSLTDSTRPLEKIRTVPARPPKPRKRRGVEKPKQ